MPDEIIDIVDENNNLTGEKASRNEAHLNGLWHRIINICIYNSRGEILLQLRSKDKMIYPDMWDISVAGHIGAGEEPIAAALRETGEETGLGTKEEDLHFYKIRPEEYRKGDVNMKEFLYIYLLKYDGDISNLKIQKEELQKIEFVPIDKIEEELKSGSIKFAPHGAYWEDVIGEVKRNLNS
ncbi:MAG: NUDIX domain-containing protein [Patescibacteria group bacterium]|nr:NUDIX domain-containing protein [Patescibacteria group bacterium]